ncbi:MAG: hypothetical protein KC933_09700 [Myxococcales bacterium]|nr:hypothetical protein [Myxococcales bacterium]MCB9647143.1 hypothetical protein [Deltaproteobacteria bacterium]
MAEIGVGALGSGQTNQTRDRGFLGRLQDGFNSFLEQSTDCAAGITSGLTSVDVPAPYRNDRTRAVCMALGATAGLAGDAFVGATGLAEMGGGATLSATGVGAIPGVPLTAAGVAQVGVAAAGSVIHANNLSNAISQMATAENAGGGGAPEGGPNGVFENNPKHGSVDRGRASKAPENGQAALDNSVQVKDTSTRRIGVDKATGEFVVLDEHLPGKFHGHVRSWGDLTSQMQNALRNAGLVNGRGKIL